MPNWLQKIAFDFDDLRRENKQYNGTAGLSGAARHFGLWAAYLHSKTGEIFCDKTIPLHIAALRFIPEKYWTKTDELGHPIAVVDEIISGFVDLNTGKFLTREQSAARAQKGKPPAAKK